MSSTGLFKKIGTQQTLSHNVHDQIIAAIISRKLSPGDKLPTEKELCDLFGVSRTAIREALQKLNAQGLVNVKKGSGTYISDYTSKHAVKPISMYLEMNLSRDLILDVIEVRKMFEPQIAYLAAKNHVFEDLEQIDKTIVQLRKTSDADYEKQGRIDHDFHMSIAQAAHNEILVMMFNPILNLMPKIRAIVYKVVDSAMSEALPYHEKIFDAIKNRDPELAWKSMAGHMEVAEEHSRKILSDLQID